MKTFTISKENLRDTLEYFWDSSEEHNLSFCLNPKANQITVIQDNATVALIIVAEVLDEYDAFRRIMEE